MDPLSDHQEFGQRLSAARGYMNLDKEKFAKEIGLSVPTITRYEKGEFGQKSREELEILAERYARVTGCPAYLLFGLDVPSEVAAEERLSRLEKSVELMNEAQGKMQERLAELDAPSDSALDTSSGQPRAGRDREGMKK